MACELEDMVRISLICDGKAGDLAQLRGLADALMRQRPCEAVFHTVAPRKLYALFMPYGPPDPRDAACFSEPWPDIAIGSGRRAVAYLRALKKRHPQTFIAFLKDPRHARDAFDFLWMPSHDRAQTRGVFKTATSPHGLSTAALAQAAAKAATRFPALFKPRALVLLGGPTKGYDYPPSLAQSLAQALRPSAAQFELMIVPSRRTPPEFVQHLTSALGDAVSYVWDGVSDNPYRELMATAQVILAPGDSHNMVSEALATSARVFVFAPQGHNRKLDHFRVELIAQNLVEPFATLPDPAQIQARAPFDVTPLIAQALLKAYDAKNA